MQVRCRRGQMGEMSVGDVWETSRGDVYNGREVEGAYEVLMQTKAREGERRREIGEGTCLYTPREEGAAGF